jgi:Uma2 family endonuclease
VLAIEVLSPSTRRVDLILKRDRFEAAGCPSHCVVDPDEPSVTVWRLLGQSYVEAARVAGTEQADLQVPYPISLVPADLLG